MREPVSGGVDITCASCSCVFKVHNYRAKEAKYCSKDCSVRGSRTGKTFICEECNKTFYRYPSKYQQPNRWCSHKCQGLYYRENGSPTTTHGLSYSSEHGIWSGMKDRCTKPNSTSFKNYGGRGIKMCDRWYNSFEKFIEDMGRRPSMDHSIDRIDVNGDYSPENCRWATAKEQSYNRRNSLIIEVDGVKKPAKEWCEIYKINYETFRQRHVYGGLPAKKALTTPVSKNENRKCKRDHVIANDFYITTGTKRECRPCSKIRAQAYRDRKKALAKRS